MQWRNLELGPCLRAYTLCKRSWSLLQLCFKSLSTMHYAQYNAVDGDGHNKRFDGWGEILQNTELQVEVSSNVSILKVASCKKLILLLWHCKPDETSVCYIAAVEAVELNLLRPPKIFISLFLKSYLSCSYFCFYSTSSLWSTHNTS